MKKYTMNPNKIANIPTSDTIKMDFSDSSVPYC